VSGLQTNAFTTNFIFVPCIFIMLIFIYKQMNFYLIYKILKIKIYIKTLFYSHCYMFRSVRTKTCSSDCLCKNKVH